MDNRSRRAFTHWEWYDGPAYHLTGCHGSALTTQCPRSAAPAVEWQQGDETHVYGRSKGRVAAARRTGLLLKRGRLAWPQSTGHIGASPGPRPLTTPLPTKPERTNKANQRQTGPGHRTRRGLQRQGCLPPHAMCRRNSSGNTHRPTHIVSWELAAPAPASAPLLPLEPSSRHAYKQILLRSTRC